MFSNVHVLGVALALSVAAGQVAGAQQGRFQGMDRNNDGRITRRVEWQRPVVQY
jgi:hypothetical protein